MKLGHAIKSGLLVGIGFQGLVLAVNLLITTIQPVMDYYKALGSGYDALEVGFAALGAASWTVPFAVFVIPAIIIVNLILVRLKITKVLNVDIWNFMHFLVPGALAYALSGNAVIGFLVAVGCGIVALFFSQWLAPKWGEFFGLEGTTCTTLAFCAWVYPVTYGLNKIIDLIPGLRDVDVNVDKLGKKLGIFGDPAVIGLLVGVFLSLEGNIARKTFPPELLASVKDTTVYTLSAIGDSVFGGSLLVFWSLVSCTLVVSGHEMAAALFTLSLFLGLQTFKALTFIAGLREGLKVLQRLKQWDLINWGDRIKMCNGLLLVVLLWRVWPHPAHGLPWGIACIMLSVAALMVGRFHISRIFLAACALAGAYALPWASDWMLLVPSF